MYVFVAAKKKVQKKTNVTKKNCNGKNSEGCWTMKNLIIFNNEWYPEPKVDEVIFMPFFWLFFFNSYK